jgi:hypothetical protein
MRDGDNNKESAPDHPLTEDVSPPVFALVALIIVVISLGVFGLLGMLP